MKLKRRNGEFPPGGFLFTDSKTGLSFGQEGEHDSVVMAIIKHRRANPRIYSQSEPVHFDFSSVANELDSFTCSRLNNNPRFCDSGELPPVSTEGMELMGMPNQCPKCGCLRGYANLCRTCAGKRIVNYICMNCKTLVQK